MANVSYRAEKSAHHAHIEWLELNKDGILHECAIMKRDSLGNVFYIKTNSLDTIDRRRLADIVSSRNAASMQLYDLMSQRTLGNGMNALGYFHQLVRVLTPQGKTIDPRQGQVGVAAIGTVTPPAASSAV